MAEMNIEEYLRMREVHSVSQNSVSGAVHPSFPTRQFVTQSVLLCQ